jgi:hypothetical protein
MFNYKFKNKGKKAHPIGSVILNGFCDVAKMVNIRKWILHSLVTCL